MKKVIHASKRIIVELVVLLGSMLALVLLSAEQDYLMEQWGINGTNLKVVAYKLCLITVILMYVHLSRKWMFPYIDLQKLMNGSPQTKSATIIGVFVFYGLVILAFMMGL